MGTPNSTVGTVYYTLCQLDKIDFSPVLTI